MAAPPGGSTAGASADAARLPVLSTTSPAAARAAAIQRLFNIVLPQRSSATMYSSRDPAMSLTFVSSYAASGKAEIGNDITGTCYDFIN